MAVLWEHNSSPIWIFKISVSNLSRVQFMTYLAIYQGSVNNPTIHCVVMKGMHIRKLTKLCFKRKLILPGHLPLLFSMVINKGHIHGLLQS
jgi:hypothetical protein